MARKTKTSDPRSSGRTAAPLSADPGVFDPRDVPGARVWSAHLERFLQRHSSWQNRILTEGPVYHLPAEVVDALRFPNANVPALLTPSQAEIEGEFRETCLGYLSNTVGVWRGNAVHYPLFGELPALRITTDLAASLGWSQYVSINQAQTQVPAAVDQTTDIVHQQIGYVGWLTFESTYQQDREALRQRYDEFEAPLPWPLKGVITKSPIAPSSDPANPLDELPPDVAKFLDDVSKFLSKWGLSQLITWDLPLPQGPLEGIPAALAANVLGPEQPVSATPAYFNPPTSTNLRAKMRHNQRHAAKADGLPGRFPIPEIAARGDRASTFETAFRMWLFEIAVRRRYGAPRGIVARLVDGFSRMLDVDVDHVKELRSKYVHSLS